MKHVIVCRLKANSDGPRNALRLEHLEYIEKHKANIVAGGPALSETGAPWMMIHLTQFIEKQAAEDFIRQEPYTASGQFFESVEVHPWSQVLPGPARKPDFRRGESPTDARAADARSVGSFDRKARVGRASGQAGCLLRTQRKGVARFCLHAPEQQGP
jgi:uncharacterized protein YciI